ncbi:MAG: PHP domain-containing protein [bacterium]|nr:PHP domain-containing protein [bacterium]
MRIDLHTHSTCSDGTDTPRELMLAAEGAGLAVVALSDHDTDAGWEEASAAVGETGVALVRAAEVTSSLHGGSHHILSYLHDPARLAPLLEDNRTLRPRRARAMVEALAADFPITWEAVLAQAGDPDTIGRPHMADALIAAGVYPDRTAAFAGAMSKGSRYYVHIEAPTPRMVVEAIVAAGGVAVLAHPFMSGRTAPLTDEEITELRDVGLFGIEADHRDHSPSERVRARALANLLGLAVTGSSDYHGAGKPNRLGEGLTEPEVLERIEAAGHLDVIRP